MELIKQIGKRWLLLDANFLLNTLHNPDEYYPIYNIFRERNIKLVTSKAVVFEIYKGTNTKEIFNIKKQFIKDKLDAVLSIHRKTLIQDSAWMTVMCREAGKRLSLVDLMLAGTLKNLSKEVVLLSADVADFPKSLFNWEGIINVELEFANKKEKKSMCSKIDTYALISFSKDKYAKSLDNFNKTKKTK